MFQCSSVVNVIIKPRQQMPGWALARSHLMPLSPLCPPRKNATWYQERSNADNLAKLILAKEDLGLQPAWCSTMISLLFLSISSLSITRACHELKSSRSEHRSYSTWIEPSNPKRFSILLASRKKSSNLTYSSTWLRFAHLVPGQSCVI